MGHNEVDEKQTEGEALPGSIANGGAVWRVGNYVYRPAGPHSESVHRLFRHLRHQGFLLAPEAISVEDGKECVSYIEGDVPHYPYPEWCKTDELLAEVALAMRQYHDACANFVNQRADEYCLDLADPQGGELICHNDIRPENVVFRDGKVAGFIDFDFAAPGRAIWDIARAVILWIPIDDPELAHSYQFGGLDPVHRLKIFCQSYGLSMLDRVELVDVIDQCGIKSEAYVRSQVEAGKPAFVEMWNTHKIGDIYDRRRKWLYANGERMISELTKE